MELWPQYQIDQVVKVDYALFNGHIYQNVEGIVERIMITREYGVEYALRMIYPKGVTSKNGKDLSGTKTVDLMWFSGEHILSEVIF